MRTAEQIRFEAAYHEASHAAAFYLAGFTVARTQICTPSETALWLAEDPRQSRVAGFVRWNEPPPKNVSQAQDLIVAILAGEAGVRGWYSRAESPDETEARQLAEEWSQDSLEAGALLHYCRGRTIDLVASPRFQHLMVTIGDALLECSELSRDLTKELLERADYLFANREVTSAALMEAAL